MTRKLVGFMGYARSGKDLACSLLGWQRIAFADALKSDISGLAARLDLNREEHRHLLRPLWVEYGKLARKVDPDYWIKRVELPTGNVCVADVRYANEARWVQRNDGLVIYVSRPKVDPANEEEATSILDVWTRCSIGSLRPVPTVLNNGTPDDLRERILAEVNKFYG